MTDPLLASGVLTIVPAAYLVVDGVFEVAAASRVSSSYGGGGWVLAGWVLSFLPGMMIWQQFPFSGAWAIGVLLGFKLLLIGMSMICVGLMARSNV